MDPRGWSCGGLVAWLRHLGQCQLLALWKHVFLVAIQANVPLSTVRVCTTLGVVVSADRHLIHSSIEWGYPFVLPQNLVWGHGWTMCRGVVQWVACFAPNIGWVFRHVREALRVDPCFNGHPWEAGYVGGLLSEVGVINNLGGPLVLFRAFGDFQLISHKFWDTCWEHTWVRNFLW